MAAAAGVHEFLHAFENMSNPVRARVSSGNQSLSSYGWNFGETNLNRPKNLELLIEASCSLILQHSNFATKSRLHEFLQQKCFFSSIHVKRHILRDARVEQLHESTGGELWRIRALLPKTS